MSTTTPTPSPSPSSSGHQRTTAGPPSLALLAAVELRKVLDTRTGRWFLAAVMALAAATVAYDVAQVDGPLDYRAVLADTTNVLRLLLPVLGVLAMTGEWSQRTALTTFALVPQRGRVLTAKVVAVLVVTVAVVALTAAVCAGAVALTAAATGEQASIAGAGEQVGASLLEVGLWMLMGAGIGALVQSTAAALVAFLVLPTFVPAAAVLSLGDARGAWVNVGAAIGEVSRLDLQGPVAAPLSALAVWIALPLAAGTMRTLRRQVS